MTISLKNILSLSLFLSASYLLSACSMDTVSSNDVATSTVHQSYSVDYYEGSNTTKYWAQFRVGGWSGTTLDLDAPSTLKVNGNEFSQSSFFGTSYSQQDSGFVNTVQFEWVDKEGQRYVNSTEITGLALVSAPTTITVSATYIVTLNGAPLASDETIEATITQSTHSESVFVSGSASNMTVMFAPSQLAKLQNGPATLNIERRKSHALTQATEEGGSISSSYHLRAVNVMVNGSSLTLATK